jgi:hypothetical protein
MSANGAYACSKGAVADSADLSHPASVECHVSVSKAFQQQVKQEMRFSMLAFCARTCRTSES